MIILLALLLLSSSTYSMLDYMGRPLRNSEAVFKDCQESLALYDDFLPGAPAMSLIAAHPKFIELMQRIANQDALWIKRSGRVLSVLVAMIYNSRDFSDFSDIPLLARVVDIFLTAAEHKGHAQFINTLTLTNHSCILSQAIEKNNLACAEVALKHNASLAIQCYSQKDRTHYYPLLYACKTFGADSPMVELLCKYKAPMPPEDRLA